MLKELRFGQVTCKCLSCLFKWKCQVRSWSLRESVGLERRVWKSSALHGISCGLTGSRGGCLAWEGLAVDTDRSAPPYEGRLKGRGCHLRGEKNRGGRLVESGGECVSGGENNGFFQRCWEVWWEGSRGDCWLWAVVTKNTQNHFSAAGGGRVGVSGPWTGRWGRSDRKCWQLFRTFCSLGE